MMRTQLSLNPEVLEQSGGLIPLPNEHESTVVDSEPTHCQEWIKHAMCFWAAAFSLYSFVVFFSCEGFS